MLIVFFNHTTTTQIYPLSLHDALPISALVEKSLVEMAEDGDEARYRLLETVREYAAERLAMLGELDERRRRHADRKSTRLNSSHVEISYAVFCLKKKTTQPGSA